MRKGTAGSHEAAAAFAMSARRSSSTRRRYTDQSVEATLVPSIKISSSRRIRFLRD